MKEGTKQTINVYKQTKDQGNKYAHHSLSCDYHWVLKSRREMSSKWSHPHEQNWSLTPISHMIKTTTIQFKSCMVAQAPKARGVTAFISPSFVIKLDYMMS